MRRRVWLLSLVVHAAVACAVLHTVRFDDAFISFRYGQNLASGRGLVFNVGEHVWGATTFLWVLLSAIVHRVVGHDATPSMMAGIGCVAWSAQCAIVFLSLRRFRFELAGALAAGAIALGMAESFTWVAMETNLVFDLAFGTIAAALAGRFYLSAVLAALAILGRPDMVVPASIALALCYASMKARTWRPLLVSAAVLAPAYAALAHAGGIIPRSAGAKYGLVSLGAYASHELRVVPAEIFAQIVATVPPASAWMGAIVVWPLVVYGGIVLVRADRRLVAWPAWLVLHLVGYEIWRPLPSQVWQLYPAIALAIMLFLVGAVALRDRLARYRLVRAVAFPAVFATLGAIALLRTVSFTKFEQHSLFWFEPRDKAYGDIARLVRAGAQPGDVVAAGEVGTLAYDSDVPVHDWNGLVNDNRALVDGLAQGEPGDVRWVVGWAPGDVTYFRRSLAGHVPRLYPCIPQHKTIYVFDLHQRGPP